eukprot:jgi/Psemu1/53446/gm1.53446_g
MREDTTQWEGTEYSFVWGRRMLCVMWVYTPWSGTGRVGQIEEWEGNVAVSMSAGGKELEAEMQRSDWEIRWCDQDGEGIWRGCRLPLAGKAMVESMANEIIVGKGKPADCHKMVLTGLEETNPTVGGEAVGIIGMNRERDRRGRVIIGTIRGGAEKTEGMFRRKKEKGNDRRVVPRKEPKGGVAKGSPRAEEFQKKYP